MTETFSITYHWRETNHVDNPYQEHEDDWTTAFRVLQRFFASHEGRFSLWFGEREIPFSLDPDLLTIFEELPDVLLSIKNGEEACLDFFEQGTDLVLTLQPVESKLKIRFHVGSSAADVYKELEGSSSLICLGVFLREWTKFLRDLLLALKEDNPDENREFLLDFLMKLDQVAEHETSHDDSNRF